MSYPPFIFIPTAQKPDDLAFSDKLSRLIGIILTAAN